MNALIHMPLLVPLLLSLPVTLPGPAPLQSRSQPAQQVQGEEEPDDLDVPVIIFTPKYSNAHELANTINQTFNDGLISKAVDARRVRAVAFDTAILVSGPEPFIHRAIMLLEELDETSRQEERSAPSAVLQVSEYPLHHLTMADASTALQPLTSNHMERGSLGQVIESQNISYLLSRSTVVVRDTAERTQEIFALLDRLDVPRQQILLRAYLVRGVDGGEDPRVPAEVTGSLRRLVPYAQFELVSFAMLRSDVGAKMGMTDAAGNAEYRMQLEPAGYDAQKRRLNFSECRFDITRVEGTARTTRQFMTSANLTADEYTVLGGVGADADFLVLHMSLIDGP